MKNKKFFSEIILTSKNVTNDEWNNLIILISKYLGLFKTWNIIVHIEMNVIHYYINTDKKLPTTIGTLANFLIKNNDAMDFTFINNAISLLPKFTKLGSNLIEMYDDNEIKYDRKLTYALFSFKLLKNDTYLHKSYFIFKDAENNLLKNKMLLCIPTSFLAINFDNHTRFFYKQVHNYLDIQKTMHVFSSDKNNAIFSVDTFPYFRDTYYLNYNNYSFDKHSLIVGASGTGKSKLISLLIDKTINNIDNQIKYKFIVIDPHAAIENDVGGLPNTKVLDFKNLNSSCDLFINGNSVSDIISQTETILELLKSLMADNYNSKLERVLRHSIYILLCNNIFNFLNLRLLLTDSLFRNNLIKDLANLIPISVTEFFLNDFNELKTRSYSEAISPIISFIDELKFIPAFDTIESLNDFKSFIDKNYLTLISLNQRNLGSKITKTISGLVMQQLMKIIQSASLNYHIILIIDEVSIIENPIINRFLSEARKYNLSVILSQQYFNQISANLKSSIMANIQNYYIFRVSREDAYLLENNLQMKVAVDNTQEKRIKVLSELDDRECIVRINNNGLLLPAFKAKTIDFESKPRLKEEYKNE